MSKPIDSPVDVSVVIPAFNMAFCLRECLTGVLAQTLPSSRFEIILVDDGSTDETQALAHKLKNELNLGNLHIVHQPNQGPAAARNHGIRLARGRIVAFLDSDCIPEPEWLERLTAPLLDASLMALVGVEGCTLPAPGPRTLMDHFIDNPHGGFYWTCNIAYRKACLLEVGGFDEGFPLPSGEDIDIAHRLKQRGEIMFVQDAIVRHLILKRSFLKHFRTARTFSSMIRLHRKHPQLLAEQTGFGALALFQFKYLLLPIVTQRREFPKAPLTYIKFCLLQVLMALDTLLRLPIYYREATKPLETREPLIQEPSA